MNTRGIGFGKVILVGEHAVVYGLPAVAAAISVGATARVDTADGETSTLEIQPWGVRARVSDRDRFAEAFRRALDASGVTARTVAATLHTALPGGGGLGSSAALGVALLSALDPQAERAEVARRAAAWESVFHGRASGVDAAVAATGGCLLYQRRRGATPIEPRCALWVAVCDTRTSAPTASMVEHVAARRRLYPARTERTFFRLGVLANRAKDALVSGSIDALGAAVDEAHGALASLGVSTPALDRACSIARSAGALGAKLTGAGGGGAAIAICGSQREATRVVAAWKGHGLRGWIAMVGSSEAPGEERAAARV